MVVCSAHDCETEVNFSRIRYTSSARNTPNPAASKSAIQHCGDHECRHENCTRIGEIRDHCVKHEKLLCTVTDCDGIAVLPDVPMHWSCAPDCDGDEDCIDHPRYSFVLHILVAWIVMRGV